jgi:hypothetical protein
VERIPILEQVLLGVLVVVQIMQVVMEQVQRLVEAVAGVLLEELRIQDTLDMQVVKQSLLMVRQLHGYQVIQQEFGGQ